MDYPEHTETKPVVGKEAELLIRAIESGGSRSSEAGLETARRIVEQIRKKKLNV